MRRSVLPHWTIYGATSVVLFVAYLSLLGSFWQGGVQLYTLIESAAILLALTIGTLALVRFYSKALRASDGRLRTLVEQTSDWLWETDANVRFVYSNPKVRQLLGRGPEEMLGKSPADLVVAAEKQHVEEMIARLKMAPQPVSGFVAHCVAADGREVILEIGVEPVFEAGRFSGTRGVARDVTVRQQAEEAVRRSEERFRSLLANIPDVAWTLNAEMRFAYISPNIERISGFSLNEITRQGARLFLDSIHPEDVERVGQAFQALFARGEPYDVECRLRRKSGEWIWVRDRALATYEKDGLRYADGLLSEITDRKRAEESLRDSETRLREIFDCVQTGILIIDPEDHRIVDANPVALQAIGLPREHVVGAECHKFVCPADRGRCPVTDLGQTVDNSERTLLTAEGGNRAIIKTVVPIRIAGRKHLLESFVEITELKRAEEDLVRLNLQLAQAVEKAQDASRAKSQFLANMSHEIRTPMNGILGMTELALATELTPEQREYVEMIGSSADSLLVVINDILDFSKIEAGKLDLEPREFNLEELLVPALKVLGLQAGGKGLDLNLHIQPAMPKIVVADGTRLRQIVVNLVGNAIKFTDRGEVTVRLACQPGNAGTTWLLVGVQDTGIGIPVDKQQAIFEAFSQADGSVTRRYGGSGLGLTISRRLVEMMGGRLWVESVPGEGSTFQFTVPLDVGRAGGRHSGPARDLTGLSVLVVDDNRTNRRILEEVLISWSMRPTVVADARTALGHLQQESSAGRPLPLVVVDANLPEIDGFALIEQIRQDPRLARAPILMLTSGGQPGDATRSRELGVAAYLTKPIGQAELRSAVLRALNPGCVETQPPPLSSPPRTTLAILLAEDNAVNQKVVSRMLEKHGHRVETAGNGREALDKLSQAHFDLVLMDIQMPEMDGLEAATAIRRLEQRTGGHIPILALTAYALKTDHDRCLAAGMDGYLSKPVRPGDLLRHIEQICAGHAVE